MCAYLKVGDTNIIICACDKHFNVIRRAMMTMDSFLKEYPQFETTLFDEPVYRVIDEKP